MKKVLIGLAVFLALVIIIVSVIPIIFKDDIKAAIDEQIDQNLNAEVFYDVDNLGLSLLSHFPSLSVGMDNFGIVGVDQFDGDTLVSVGSFEVAVNLFSLMGSKIVVDGIYLNDAKINVIVLEDGSANYDIAVASEEVAQPEEESPGGAIDIGIDRWEINDAVVIYDDRTLPFFMSLQGLNHSGSGDFGSNVFDMVSETAIAKIDVSFDGIEYLSDKQLAADITLGMDLNAMKFTFKENNIRLNDFGIGFDGFVAMPGDDINMDMTFGAKETAFKSVLSLVPGVFLEGFEDLKTSGEFQFDGKVAGTFNETTMPAFNVGLQVSDAMFQYPDLPTAITNINTDMRVDNRDGNIDNTTINVSQFHMDMGNNPIDAKLFIKNLINYDMDADVSARLDLAELASMVPMEGLNMKGIFEANLKASGVYDSIAQTIPTIDLNMALADGYVKYDEYPIPMEDMQMQASIINTSTKMAETVIKVDQFGMLLDGEKVGATLTLENLEDFTWDLAVHGAVDLEKVMKIFPQEGMELKGKIKADLDSKGKMSDVDAERYDRLTTAGNMEITDLYYVSEDLPQGFGIKSSQASFNPKAIQLKKFDATAGRSDMQVNGTIMNYMAYALEEDAILDGTVIFKSSRFDLNEWMSDEETPVTTEEDTTTLEVVKVPENINFLLRSSIDQVLYDNLTLTNLNGDIIVRDGAINLNGVGFNLLDGEFEMDGAYVTKDLENPEFDFDFGIQAMSISKSYEAFNMVQALAPIAQNITGDFSTNFKMSGALGQDMMPIYESLSGAGLIDVAKAAVKDVKILQSISSVTNLGSTSLNQGTIADITDLVLSAKIEGGRFAVDPFDINLGGRSANISGSTGLDGSLDYVINTSVPAGAAGSAVNSALASLTGGNNVVGDEINLKLALKGTYDNPQVGIAGAEPGEGGATAGVQTAVKQQAEQELEVQKEKAKEELKEQQAEVEKEIEEKASQELQKLVGDSTIAAPVEEAKDLIQGLFKKKKKEGGQ
ncbi:MAG: AsmA-like C-terminal region-containing protein [Bacteroidota bacterium]